MDHALNVKDHCQKIEKLIVKFEIDKYYRTFVYDSKSVFQNEKILIQYYQLVKRVFLIKL